MKLYYVTGLDMEEHVKNAWTWWKSMNSPKNIVAPMVDASELPWRVLSRKYGLGLTDIYRNDF